MDGIFNCRMCNASGQGEPKGLWMEKVMTFNELSGRT